MKDIKTFDEEINISDSFIAELIYKVLGAGSYYSTMPVARGIVSVLKKQQKQYTISLITAMRDEMMGDWRVDNNQGSTNRGYNLKREEIKKIADKYIKKI